MEIKSSKISKTLFEMGRTPSPEMQSFHKKMRGQSAMIFLGEGGLTQNAGMENHWIHGKITN
jgi:hypothetical protein